MVAEPHLEGLTVHELVELCSVCLVQLYEAMKVEDKQGIDVICEDVEAIRTELLRRGYVDSRLRGPR